MSSSRFPYKNYNKKENIMNISPREIIESIIDAMAINVEQSGLNIDDAKAELLTELLADDNHHLTPIMREAALEILADSNSPAKNRLAKFASK
jgi:hypothetical protein